MELFKWLFSTIFDSKSSFTISVSGLFIIFSTVFSGIQMDTIDASYKKFNRTDINGTIIENLESVCIDEKIEQCYTYEEPHPVKIEISTNKYKVDTSTLKLVPNKK